MINRASVPILAGVMAVASASLALPVQASDFPRVTQNVRVTHENNSPVRDDSIPVVAIDPSDSQHVVVAEGDYRTGSCLLHISTNGGQSFVTAKRSPIPPEFSKCTPNGGTMPFAMGFLSNGTLLVALGGTNPPGTLRNGPGSVIVSRTSDNGQNWQSTIVRDNRTSAAAEGMQQVQLQVDQARNRVYVAWQRTNVKVPGLGNARRAVVAVSTDGGASFSKPVDVGGDQNSTLSVGSGPVMALGPSGRLYVIYSESTPAKTAPATFKALTPTMRLATSTDGGQTFTRSVIGDPGQLFGFPSAAASTAPGGKADDIVLVFENQADGAAGQQQVREIFSRRSADGGKTWGDRVRVTDDNVQSDLANKFVPNVSAAPDGRFDAAWIDMRNDDGNQLTDTYYAYSNDGGATWSKNMRVSDQSSNRHYGQFANYSDVRGPVGLASNDYGAYISWDDSRLASPSKDVQDVFFGDVQLAALPTSSGFTALRVLAAVAGGLVATALILLFAGISIRRRRQIAALKAAAAVERPREPVA